MRIAGYCNNFQSGLRDCLRESFILGVSKPENFGKMTSFTVLSRKDRSGDRRRDGESRKEGKPVTSIQNPKEPAFPHLLKEESSGEHTDLREKEGQEKRYR